MGAGTGPRGREGGVHKTSLTLSFWGSPQGQHLDTGAPQPKGPYSPLEPVAGRLHGKHSPEPERCQDAHSMRTDPSPRGPCPWRWRRSKAEHFTWTQSGEVKWPAALPNTQEFVPTQRPQGEAAEGPCQAVSDTRGGKEAGGGGRVARVMTRVVSKSKPGSGTLPNPKPNKPRVTVAQGVLKVTRYQDGRQIEG